MIVTVGAKELGIAHGSNPEYWKYCSHPDSRFTEVAQLSSVCWLDVNCKIKAQSLSPKTSYGAYLIFKLVPGAGSYGLESVRGTVRFCDHETSADSENRATLLHLQQNVESRCLAPKETGWLASCGKDGWMEIELGDFIIDCGDEGEVEARMFEVKDLGWKAGLIVEGIEFRPKQSLIQNDISDPSGTEETVMD